MLAKLDDEILELTEESEVEAKVEQADEARAKINVAIITIEDAVSLRNVHSRRKGSRHGEVGKIHDGSSLSDTSEEERTDLPHTVTNDHRQATSTLPVPSVGTASISSMSVITTSPTLPLWTTSVFHLLGTLPHSTALMSIIPLTPPTLPLGGLLLPGLSDSKTQGLPSL